MREIFSEEDAGGIKLLNETRSFIINEGQFFEDLYEVVDILVNKYNKIVYVGGLDGDYKMKKFGNILDLIPICDSVEKLTAICSSCKSTAAFTKRITEEDEQLLIGSSDKYIPVCRKCHSTETNNIHISKEKIKSA